MKTNSSPLIYCSMWYLKMENLVSVHPPSEWVLFWTCVNFPSAITQQTRCLQNIKIGEGKDKSSEHWIEEHTPNILCTCLSINGRSLSHPESSPHKATHSNSIPFRSDVTSPSQQQLSIVWTRLRTTIDGGKWKLCLPNKLAVKWFPH